MSGKLCFLITVIYLTKSAVLADPVPCHSDNKSPYPYTGTKTPYSYAHDNDEENMTLTNCKPTQIWMLIRHGTRYPADSTIARILNLTQIQDRITTNNMHETCAQKIELKNWKPYPELVPGKGKYLAAQGEKDLASLAERIKAKLPTLFNENATKSFKFRSTAEQRTIESMKSFIKGAFDISPKIENTSSEFESMNIQQTITVKSLEGAASTSIKLEVVPLVNDTLLKLYDTCESWKSIDTHKEVNAFINGPEIGKVLADVSQRLGLNNISEEDVFLFYDTCRFERALHLDEPSPWCGVFTDDEMRIFEYEEDLYYYYRAGPGEKINSEIGCYPIRDMFDHFTKLNVTGDEPRGVFYFTHSTMMTLFLTAMGIAKDPVPLTAANFRDMSYRNWRMSLLVPFAANFAAVFHRCDSSDTPFKVAFYLNENPLTLDGCENGVCDWTELKKKLDAIAANCSTEVCHKKVVN